MARFRQSYLLPLALSILLVLTAGIAALIFSQGNPAAVQVGQVPPSFHVTGVEAVRTSLDQPEDKQSISYGLPTKRLGASSDLAPFSTLVEDQVAAWRERYESGRQALSAPSSLRIWWQIPVASGGVLAEQLAYAGSGPGAVEHDYALLYTDLATGSAWPAPDLLASDAATELAKAVSVSPDFVPALPDSFDVTDPVLLPTGELLVGVAQADSAAEKLWLRVSALHAPKLLSPVGMALRNKVMAGPLFGEPLSLADDAAPHPSSLPSPLLPSPSVAPSASPTPAPSASSPPAPTPLPTPSSSPTPAPGSAPAPTPSPAPSATTDCAKVKCIALTFDDGPGKFTDALLAHLAKADAQATFFVLGENAELRPAALAKIAAAGHLIGNHSYSHANFTELTAEQLEGEVSATNQAISAVVGYEPTYVRPPYGAVDASTRSLLKSMGAHIMLWSIDSEDWRTKDRKAIAQQVISQAKPGGVVLMHDIHEESVLAVPVILRELKAQGYHFVTVDEI